MLVILIVALQIMNVRHVAKKDAEIKDLNERLIARNHSEYQQNIAVAEEVPEQKYSKPISFWDAPIPLKPEE